MDGTSPYVRAPFVQGPTMIREEICEYFKQAIPRAIQYAQANWGEGVFLPEPQAYLTYEPTGISHRTGPIFGVGVTSTQASEQIDMSPAMEVEMLTRYGIRLYLWVYTPETTSELVTDEARERTLAARDDLSTLIRSMLYNDPGMHLPDVFGVQLNTIREDFSDATPVPNQSGRYLAAVAISFSLDVEESLFRPVLGTVSTAGDERAGVRIHDEITGVHDEHFSASQPG